MCRLSVAALCPLPRPPPSLWAASLWLLTVRCHGCAILSRTVFNEERSLDPFPVPRSAEGERRVDGKFVFQTSGEGTRFWKTRHMLMAGDVHASFSFQSLDRGLGRGGWGSRDQATAAKCPEVETCRPRAQSPRLVQLWAGGSGLVACPL